MRTGRRIARLPVFLCALGAAAACSSSSKAPGAGGSGSSSDPHDAGRDHAGEEVDSGHDASAPLGMHLTGQTIQVGAATRTYDITLPATCDSTHLWPLVILFHGDGGTGADMYGSNFPIEPVAAAMGDEATFVYPDGTDQNQNGSAWDIYDDPGMYPYTKADPTGNPDVDFFDALVEKIEMSGCVDTSRVFVTGFSNGGYMTNQIARWRSRSMVVKAAVPQSGGPPAGSTTPSNDYAPPNYCVGTTQAVPTLIIHGAADTTVAPENCQQSASYWDMANSCSGAAMDCSSSTNSLLAPPATPTSPTTPSPCVTSTGCKPGYPVVLCEIPGMGHQIWSEAPRTIWSFFAM
jgi:polyhydroxybutyrate depolymerase